ncbi:hypothetical protein RF11_13952 [Thelohanellus kitauei]|uniref:Uncharacterized protein n=1 Tax=Thelohanellus kitauei TaxID=669202 RepID=A0A0C2M9H6_THEKT|nr:hypothetical protein RF11_13952 [Thelohanellus kitauei]
MDENDLYSEFVSSSPRLAIKILPFINISHLCVNYANKAIVVSDSSGPIKGLQLQDNEYVETFKIDSIKGCNLAQDMVTMMDFCPDNEILTVAWGSNLSFFTKSGFHIYTFDFRYDLNINCELNGPSLIVKSFSWSKYGYQLFVVSKNKDNESFLNKMNMLKMQQESNDVVVFYNSKMIYLTSYNLELVGLLNAGERYLELNFSNLSHSDDNMYQFHFPMNPMFKKESILVLIFIN